MKNSNTICTQKDVNIRINKETKTLFDWLKITYNFHSFSDCIFHIHHFFSNNNISPRDQISNVFAKNFLEFKTDMKKLDSNLKKMDSNIKTYDRDFLIPISRKINSIFENQNIQSIEKRNQLLIEVEKEPNIIALKNKEILKLTQDINSIKQLNNLMEKSINSIDEDIQFYRNLHRILNKKTKIEKQLLGKDKILIDMEVDEWKRILSYVEVFKKK